MCAWRVVVRRPPRRQPALQQVDDTFVPFRTVDDDYNDVDSGSTGCAEESVTADPFDVRIDRRVSGVGARNVDATTLRPRLFQCSAKGVGFRFEAVEGDPGDL